ncbi:ribonuclease HII [Eubacterium sulci ATCC 35585]|jgi:ribonuclease HII|nr:ribonuclease HII [Eubacterium sulci ATCC 35585]MBF1142500.1 ribonuclease HII [[Eubacterium] sulci]EUC78712.1 ribonuclease HII [Eubacterium sulci ATCC 35585]MBF1150699.1 ribonuclease HII [[Eubacterium] sulci]MBF1151251.1 ribonuclease HII [[Eubacterium] sulci]
MTKAERLELAIKRTEELRRPEIELMDKGYSLIAGVDEVGRGPLAGPVVAAACIFDRDVDIVGIDDSKKLSEKKREQFFDEIKDKALAYGIGEASCEVIDEINILEATKLAMKRAIDEADKMLESKGRDRIQIVIFDAVKINDLKKEQMSVIKGDQTYFSVAAASILAKVTRDNLMKEYDKVYPEYGFASNKGYGTKAHYEGIKKAGITEIHRKSFLKNLDTH